MMVTNSRVDAENNAFVYCNTVFTDREQPPPRAKYASFSSMGDLPEKT